MCVCVYNSYNLKTPPRGESSCLGPGWLRRGHSDLPGDRACLPEDPREAMLVDLRVFWGLIRAFLGLSWGFRV